jgi:dipeptidyl aminopeptidase/acylaminoacyl peptidase
MTKQALPHGLWPSPITPAMLAGSIRLNDVQWSPDGNFLVWSQSQDGKTSLLAWKPDESAWDLTGDFNPSGSVGYGGGDFYAGNNQVLFADRNGRLYSKPYGAGLPRVITPGFGGAAAPVLSPDEKFIVFVHTYEGKDLLAVVDTEGSEWPKILRQGADFYMQPAISPDGSRLAWIEWDHPEMPWDGTRLMLGRLSTDGMSLDQVEQLDGDRERAVFQPCFSPDGTKLVWLVNNAEFDDLVVLDLAEGRTAKILKDQNLLPPAWVQGRRALNWHPDGKSIYYLENQLGSVSLKQVFLESKQSELVDTGAYTLLEQPTLSRNGEIACIAQSSSLPARIIVLKDGQPKTIARSQADFLELSDLSTPREFSWTSSDGAEVHGLYYAPANKNFSSDGPPPTIVYVHGGPTSQVFDAFNLEAAFFTSRGYAFFAVNYRGSTGYGRTYRNALRENWGKIDLQDTIEGSQALVRAGLADPNKLVIKGGSAGGFTLLNALVHYPGFFKAGLCSYGVSNLFDLDTHKFELHYNTSLVGELPEAAAKYHAWSPVYHADKIRDAVAIFQGSDDKVVPPEHSESIVRLLRANHVPHEYKLYEGEGHGFRKKANLIDYYETVDRFLKQHVVFSFKEEA